MVKLLETEQELEKARSILYQNFTNAQDEIIAATLKLKYKNIDYKERIIFGLEENNELVAVAIGMPRNIKPHKTLEIIWFSTDEQIRLKGFGSQLFSQIQKYSKQQNFSAVLCTSTNKASTWWLSRSIVLPELTMCKTILRSGCRISMAKVKVSKTDNPIENEKYTDSLNQVTKALDVKFEAFPKNRNLEILYSDKVLRSYKGKILKGQTFKGTPYRYNIKDSNHIWFLNNKKLITSLGCKPQQHQQLVEL